MYRPKMRRFLSMMLISILVLTLPGGGAFAGTVAEAPSGGAVGATATTITPVEDAASASPASVLITPLSSDLDDADIEEPEVVINPVTRVTLPATAQMNRGATLTLNPTFVPLLSEVTTTTVTWTSASPAIATVNNNGVVTGVNPGVARITVTAQSEGAAAVSATTAVTVRIPATAVRFAAGAFTFDTGRTHQLNPIFTPANFTRADTMITYTSSNPRIATVTDTGLVNPLRRGSTIITVRAQTVGGAVITATTRIDVRVRPTSVTTLPGLRIVRGRAVTLPAFVQPFDAFNRDRRFTSSNTRVATVNARTGRIQARRAGTTTITIRSTVDNRVARVTVRVVPRAVRLQNFTIQNANQRRTISVNQAVRLRAVPRPATATNFMPTFSSSNSNIARVDRSGFIIGVNPGQVRITARQGNISRSVWVTVVSNAAFPYVNDVGLRFTRQLSQRTTTQGIVLHHTVGNIDIFQTHRIHLNAGMLGAAYHFLIDRQGRIWQGRPMNTAGGHIRGNLNNSTVGIAWVGNFQNEQMTPAARASGERLIRDLLRTYPGIRWIHGHGSLRSQIDATQSATACPGRNFPTQHFRNLLR